MKIQTNTAASFALGYMSVNEKNTQQSIQRLSSGFRINRAGDDAAGLAIANKLRNDGKALGQAQKNAAQGASMLQTMDGATQQVSQILDRMKELATQGNSANIGSQGSNLQNEFSQLRSEVQQIADTTQYQGQSLVDGTFGNALDSTTSTIGVTGATPSTTTSVGVSLNGTLKGSYTLAAATTGTGSTAVTTLTLHNTADGTATTNDQAVSVNGDTLKAGSAVSFDRYGVSLAFSADTTVGATAGAAVLGGTNTIGVSGTSGQFQVGSSGHYTGGDLIAVDAINLKTDSTGLGLEGLDISTQAGAAKALSAIDTAVNSVNASIGKLGAAESRVDFASSMVATTIQNTQAAESTIRDTDMAQEMTNFTKNNVLQQAAQSMLSQANSGTQNILQLLRG